MDKKTFKLVMFYDFKVVTLDYLSEPTDQWEAMGADSAVCLWENVPKIWMEGFTRKLETLKEKSAYPTTQLITNEKSLADNRNISKRTMMLD